MLERSCGSPSWLGASTFVTSVLEVMKTINRDSPHSILAWVCNSCGLRAFLGLSHVLSSHLSPEQLPAWVITFWFSKFFLLECFCKSPFFSLILPPCYATMQDTISEWLQWFLNVHRCQLEKTCKVMKSNSQCDLLNLITKPHLLVPHLRIS